jgi:transposase
MSLPGREQTPCALRSARSGPHTHDQDFQDGRADRTYDAIWLRDTLAERGANVRPLAARKTALAFSSRVYRQRHSVERFLNKVKHFRAVATRYDKRNDKFLASVQLASTRVWLRSYESVT